MFFYCRVQHFGFVPTGVVVAENADGTSTDNGSEYTMYRDPNAPTGDDHTTDLALAEELIDAKRAKFDPYCKAGRRMPHFSTKPETADDLFDTLWLSLLSKCGDDSDDRQMEFCLYWCMMSKDHT